MSGESAERQGALSKKRDAARMEIDGLSMRRLEANSYCLCTENLGQFHPLLEENSRCPLL